MYTNPKTVCVDKIVNYNLEKLNDHFTYQRCLTAHKVMLNLLALVYFNPTEFAYAYYGEAGHTVTVAGEVIHLISCTPVEVQTRASERCFSELAVLQGNQSYFMSPRTRILQKHGTEVSCNSILPSIFQIVGSWYAYVPYTSKEPDPITLDPNNPEKLTLKTTYNLAKGGI